MVRRPMVAHDPVIANALLFRVAALLMDEREFGTNQLFAA